MGGHHTQDWFEGKLGEIQNRMDQMAEMNAANAAQFAKDQAQILGLQQGTQLAGEQLLALTFLFNQSTQRTARYGFLYEALDLASNSYMGILSSEGHKPLDISLVVTIVGFAVVPEFMALGTAMKMLKDEWKVASSSLKLMGQESNLRRTLASGTDGKDKRGVYDVVNRVVREVYDRINADESAMAAVVQAFTLAIFSGIPQPLKFVQDSWNRAKLAILQPEEFAAGQRKNAIFSELLLYDMLRAYTWNYVAISFEGPAAMMLNWSATAQQGCETLGSEKLNDIPNGSVKVRGLSSEQREMIYERFSKVPWADTSRPPVNSWRDLVSIWSASVPGFQTDRRVSARCIGR